MLAVNHIEKGPELGKKHESEGVVLLQQDTIAVPAIERPQLLRGLLSIEASKRLPQRAQIKRLRNENTTLAGRLHEALQERDELSHCARATDLTNKLTLQHEDLVLRK
ncbi:hypothetical protein PG997_002880 [Apiospora hydei]|uniref:Uncharacterized protein n=1 Tax=Apiospora hydei TaxID=1337664 RepID=A0ABR1WXR7_9PEZI